MPHGWACVISISARRGKERSLPAGRCRIRCRAIRGTRRPANPGSRPGCRGAARTTARRRTRRTAGTPGSSRDLPHRRARRGQGSRPAGHDGRTPPARGGGCRSACPRCCETIICVTAPTKESPFLRACRRQPVPHTPVWFMRQAGRSLPEYRATRKKRKSMLATCMTPDLVTELTLQPLRRYHVDAAILFSDIVVPLRAVGVDVDIKPGIGPVIGQPVRRQADLARLRALEPSDVSYLVPAISSLVAELGGTPLIGFAGGPFTLASYLVEGGPSKNQERTKALMYGDPRLWHDLLARLTDITIAFLQVQVSASASAVPLFDF